MLGAVSVLVLDEADEMLDLGFLPDMERVLGMVPTARQTMLFSATMPGPIITLARSFMIQPTHIRAELPAESMVHKTTRQVIYRAHALDKVEMLARMLQARDRGLTMVFTRTKRTAAKVADELTERGFAAAAVHGDLGQGAREQALRAFRTGKVDVLVATDVAARGIDVEDVTHVINYQCPEDEKTYIHRIGRTGRAGRSGVAISFIDWDDVPRWKLINEALDLGVPDPVETYSSSAHLRTDLDIPEGTTGRLPLGAADPRRPGRRGGRRHRGDRPQGPQFRRFRRLGWLRRLRRRGSWWPRWPQWPECGIRPRRPGRARQPWWAWGPGRERRPRRSCRRRPFGRPQPVARERFHCKRCRFDRRAVLDEREASSSPPRRLDHARCRGRQGVGRHRRARGRHGADTQWRLDGGRRRTCRGRDCGRIRRRLRPSAEASSLGAVTTPRVPAGSPLAAPRDHGGRRSGSDR